MSDETDGADAGSGTDESDGVARARRECEVCGESVPAAIYREHLLKACPGR